MCLDTAEVSSQFSSFGTWSKHPDPGPRSIGIVACRCVGTVPDILGLVWPSFRTNSGSKSEVSGRILNNFGGRFSSAEGGVARPEHGAREVRPGHGIQEGHQAGEAT